VNAKLPLLATYMGHVSIVSTEYYLQFVEPLARRGSNHSEDEQLLLTEFHSDRYAMG
jgi:hypothetical protein